MKAKPKAAVKKIARIRDKATESYLEVIEFPISKMNPSLGWSSHLPWSANPKPF